MTLEEQHLERLGTYVFMDKTVKALETAFSSNTNIVLFGKGGHGGIIIS